MNAQTHTTITDAKLILSTLVEAGHPSMFAGGCVRDRLLGIIPKDFDIATQALPEVTTSIFQSKKFKVIPTGIDHGTVTILTNSGPVEVTTLRRDVKTDGRHAVVEFTGATFQSDASRRDFTINAMFEDVSGQVHDFYDGQKDLKARVLRFVGEPEQRIREDFLRILRFFRFLARFDLQADPSALNAITKEAHGIKHVSQERIAKELWGIFSAKQSLRSLTAMKDSGVLDILLPLQIDVKSLSGAILKASALPADLSPWAVFVLLLGMNQPQAVLADAIKNISRHLRFSEADGSTLVDLMVTYRSLEHLPRETSYALDLAEYIESRGHHFKLSEFYAPIWKVAAEAANDAPKIEQIDWVVSTDMRYQSRRLNPLPCTGHDVVAVAPQLTGQALGHVMKELKKSFRNGLWTTKDSGLAYLKILLADSRGAD